ncbi:DUF4913 domain-containing protein [Nocardia sp. XZ_19_369]|uniref:DUF4913 domain-containing protein n=1 Tax=Nocardia sp. XZ_19_369 TaxID=2769487 RepID=UPI0027D2CD26|nr:DUF4913 domain-containing protein [Nocardia sp. XZ_19_369]
MADRYPDDGCRSHAAQADALQTTNPVDPLATTCGCPADGTAQQWQYRSLGGFLRDFLAHAYARQVTDKSDTAWCPEPWRHREGFERLGTLWQTYEHAMRNPDPKALNDWWLFCADPHMRVLLDPAGPFKFCSVRYGHKEMLQALPMDFAKAPELFLEVAAPVSAASDAAA